MEIRVRVPRVPAGLLANLLGLAGLIAIAVAVGALVGNWWWSAIVGGVFAVALSWLATAEPEPAAVPAAVPSRPVAVARSA